MAFLPWELVGHKGVIMTGCRGSHQPHSRDLEAHQEVIGTRNQLGVTTGVACLATHNTALYNAL